MPLPHALRSRTARAGSIAASAAVVALLAAGCGGGSSDSGGSGGAGGGGNVITAATGPDIFEAANCASCHVMASEGASGRIGPNLDEAKPSAEVVSAKVTNGDGSMPAFSKRLTPEQIQTLATYVAENAGK